MPASDLTDDGNTEAEALRRQLDDAQQCNRELARINDELASADRRKTEFLATLAHELRNPLAPIQTAVDLMRELADRPVPPRVVDTIQRQLRHITRLVDDLMDLSKIVTNKIELRREPVALADVIEMAVAELTPRLEARNQRLVLAPMPEDIVVIGDSVRLVQVVSNLLSNANRYTRSGGRIELAWEVDQHRAHVRITDDGIGIAPDLLEKIFEMFVQERAHAEDSAGLGVGLPLTRQLMELHGGGVKAHSEGRGLGSVFHLWLPLAGSPDPLAGNPPDGHAAGVPLPFSKPGHGA